MGVLYAERRRVRQYETYNACVVGYCCVWILFNLLLLFVRWSISENFCGEGWSIDMGSSVRWGTQE